ncbi:hypothetical protein QEZ54_09860 [Catellatospora sp. KI3]|uniref:hypothetical protein n=1 Tax=Catellatospora sp. KI3 TaxID=3041620 RepID=UPI0024827A71|nr:hypothetical protein [Catellatospora sp. KI3]MDI1461272.1 hypothetical protein [Catellatospora sp. KI3]
MSTPPGNRVSPERWTAVAAVIAAVLGVVSSPVWGPPLCAAVGVCQSAPGQPSPDDPGGSAATGATGSPNTRQSPNQPPQSAAVVPVELNSISRNEPGCDERDTRVVWDRVKADVECSAEGTTLRKQIGWDDGYLKSYAELRMSLKDQRFPSAFKVTFVISGLSAPELDMNRGGCGGLAVHTSADSGTYDYFNVCGDGWVETIRVIGHSGADNQTRQLPPSGSYAVIVDVTAAEVRVTVSNRIGQSTTVSSPAVGGTTAYLSLMTTWRNAGATATFSDFSYSTAG